MRVSSKLHGTFVYTTALPQKVRYSLEKPQHQVLLQHGCERLSSSIEGGMPFFFVSFSALVM
jgi:hypothetical protein